MIGKMKTPQTDDLARGNHVVPTEWAEQLERERDEAREKYDDLATEHMLAVNKLAEERDEARDRMAQLLNEKEEAIQQSMRDARRADANAALCSKLRDIAERAIDDLRWFYESKADGIILELDQLKEGAK
jgi:hypothetical protein